LSDITALQETNTRVQDIVNSHSTFKNTSFSSGAQSSPNIFIDR